MEEGKSRRIDLVSFCTTPDLETWEDNEYAGTVNDHKFTATRYDGNMVDLWLKEPDGTVWTAKCGFEYGAGWTD